MKLTVSTPIPTGASRAAIIAHALEFQAGLGLDTKGERPELEMAERIGTVHHHGRRDLFGHTVTLVSDAEAKFEFWPSHAFGHEVPGRKNLAQLVGHAVLHRPMVTEAHGPGSVMIVRHGFVDEAPDDKRAVHEAMWFGFALALPRAAVLEAVVTQGHAGARRACAFGPETFDTVLRYHELGHLIPEAA